MPVDNKNRGKTRRPAVQLVGSKNVKVYILYGIQTTFFSFIDNNSFCGSGVGWGGLGWRGWGGGWYAIGTTLNHSYLHLHFATITMPRKE